MPDSEMKIAEQPKEKDKEPVWHAGLAGLIAGLICTSALAILIPNFGNRLLGKSIVCDNTLSDTPAGLAKLQKEIVSQRKEISILGSRLERKTPSEPYLVVDTSDNKLFLKSRSRILREATCSTGSYVLLKAPTGQKWVFYTPRGMFRVIGKKRAPIWVKPDWAFIEEGRSVPPPDSPERIEVGVLGDYALSFGSGYLIHGTLYQRFLGLPVTHGCIRLGDEDLKDVYESLQIGSKIFIY